MPGCDDGQLLLGIDRAEAGSCISKNRRPRQRWRTGRPGWCRRRAARPRLPWRGTRPARLRHRPRRAAGSRRWAAGDSWKNRPRTWRETHVEMNFAAQRCFELALRVRDERRNVRDRAALDWKESKKCSRRNGNAALWGVSVKGPCGLGRFQIDLLIWGHCIQRLYGCTEASPLNRLFRVVYVNRYSGTPALGGRGGVHGVQRDGNGMHGCSMGETARMVCKKFSGSRKAGGRGE